MSNGHSPITKNGGKFTSDYDSLEGEENNNHKLLDGCGDDQQEIKEVSIDAENEYSNNLQSKKVASSQVQVLLYDSLDHNSSS